MSWFRQKAEESEHQRLVRYYQTELESLVVAKGYAVDEGDPGHLTKLDADIAYTKNLLTNAIRDEREARAGVNKGCW